MSLTIAAQSCRNHPRREAVARCPECTQFFCRECITEHDDRIICSACLKKLTAKPEKPRRNYAPLARVLAAFAGFIISWMFFFFVGRVLADLPSSFHDSAVWRPSWWQEDE
jgi:hypothetical protein